MEKFNSWGQKYLRVHVDMINGTRYTFQDFAMAVKVEKVALPDPLYVVQKSVLKVGVPAAGQVGFQDRFTVL